MSKQKTNRYVKSLLKHKANGHSAETLVKWWNRLVSFAKIEDGKALFYLDESVPTGHGCYRFTGKRYIAYEMAVE